MKNFLFGTFFVVVICGYTVWGQSCYEKKAVENYLMLANVEALADGDAGASKYSICYHESKVKVGYTYYDCDGCKKEYDEKGIGSYSKCFH